MTERIYHGFPLDPFQAQAFAAIDQGKSVLVSAPTGTGKTLVADYLVENAILTKKQIIYTAPIKALSNQKYKDFKKEFGENQVGIMTGDVVLNPGASVLIMTTEIFRNQVITEDAKLQNVSYVIFDEIHWLNDEERGTVWEESIILAPKGIKILGLSATIANAQSLRDWISSIREEDMVLIEEPHRIVPLEYAYYTKETGPVSYEKLWKYYRQALKNRHDDEVRFSTTTHLDLIRSIQGKYLPALYFVFSRKQCAEKARELASITNYLNPNQRQKVDDKFSYFFGPAHQWSVSTRQLHYLCLKGIAYHHAGLLPLQKTIIEELFLDRLISILYCTETFSVGINYPVKAVCFDSLNKYDGRNFRSLANHEFFQMSGRAGRRGIDEKGYSFALVDLNYMEKSPPPKFQLNRLEPLTSQFKLSYNTVLNLLASLNPQQITTYFKKSFAAFSYLNNSQVIYEKLAQIKDKLDALKEEVCLHLGTFRCPVKYFPKKKELERLKKAYYALGPRRQHRVYGREMARKIRTWEKLLSEPPQKCTPKCQMQCQSLSKNLSQLQEQENQLKQELKKLPDAEIFIREFEYKKNQLNQMNYLEDSTLLPRGKTASVIYVQELLVTELIYSPVFSQLDDDQLNALLSAIDFESRKNDWFAKETVLDWTPIREIASYIQGICGPDAIRYDSRVAVITYAWSQGYGLDHIQTLCNLDEGDIISVFRRTIDLQRQMRDANLDPALSARLKVCMDKLDRDEAAITELD